MADEDASTPVAETAVEAPVETPAEKPKEDVVLVHGRTDDGALQILRKKGEELSAGELRPLEEGKPIQGDVLRLRPRKEMPLLCDVEEEVVVSGKLKGPAKIATEKYRDGWDKLWGKKKKAQPN